MLHDRGPSGIAQVSLFLTANNRVYFLLTLNIHHHHVVPTSTDIPDPLSPLLPIIHRLWQVFRVTSCVLR